MDACFSSLVMQKEGLIFKVHGKGSFVSRPKAFQNISTLQGFAEQMSEHGHEVIHATPEQYTKEITIANDGIVNQAAVYAYARHSYTTIEQLDRLGVKFEKDATGDYAMKEVHHLGTYVLPMPEGHDIKKVLYRQLKRSRIEITNRIVVTRMLLADDGSVCGILGFDCRTADFYVVRAKSVIPHQGLQRPGLRLCDRPPGRLHGQWQGRALHRVRLYQAVQDADPEVRKLTRLAITQLEAQA